MAETNYLYKYVRYSLRTLEALVRNTVYLATPPEFNDPFDCNMQLNIDLTSEDLTAWIIAQAKKNHTLSESEREHFRSEANRILAKSGGKIPPIYMDAIQSAGQEAIERANKRGILCLSELNDSVLMWSLYAENHAGLCIQYPRIAGNGLFEYAKRVNYQEEFPLLSVSDALGENPVKAYDEILSTKFKVWEYEQEWRVITEPAGVRQLAVPITGVIFGVRMPDQYKAMVRQVLQGKSPVRFFQAMKSPDKFRVVIV